MLLIVEESPSGNCIYCDSSASITRDHVPPRSIFPAELPDDTQLVTAPACSSCHKTNQKDDSTIRNILISTRETETHQ
jgi:hypothetical protein